MSIREPVVAGAFYPGNREKLVETIENSFLHPLGPGELPEKDGDKGGRTIKGLILPHAGYVYSGPAAAHGYLELSRENEPETIVIIGPNHTGLGASLSMWGEGGWRTPLGLTSIDEELAERLNQISPSIEYNDIGHSREHSIEVQLPFIQYIFQDVKILPIVMGYQNLETSRELGRAISEARDGKDIMVLASTDLTHQESQSSANEKDHKVIDAIKSMDEENLQQRVRKDRISMCGYGPVSATLLCCKEWGAKEAELLKYYTSGDITGDKYAVVGYASIKIK
jgi:hypothetical protein